MGKAISLAFLLLALTGCAQVETRPAAIERATQFHAVEGRGVLYVVRDFRGFEGMAFAVSVRNGDGNTIAHAALLEHSFARFVIPAGEYAISTQDMTMSLFDYAKADRVTMEPGSVRFFTMVPAPSWSGTRLVFDEMSPADGRSRITEKRLVLMKADSGGE